MKINTKDIAYIVWSIVMLWLLTAIVFAGWNNTTEKDQQILSLSQEITRLSDTVYNNSQLWNKKEQDKKTIEKAQEQLRLENSRLREQIEQKTYELDRLLGLEMQR